MSQELQPYSQGLTEKELQLIEEFKSEGLPGISSAKPELIKYGLQLYLENHAFGYICQKTGLKKKIVLYLAQRDQWHDKRVEMYSNMAMTLQTRVQAAKLQGLDYLTEMASASKKYFQDKIDLYKQTGDPSILETLDPNLVKMHHKVLELLFKMGSDGTEKDKGPLVGINFPQGATIAQNNDNTITVTPNTSADSQVVQTSLNALAALKRIQEELEEQKKKEK